MYKSLTKFENEKIKTQFSKNYQPSVESKKIGWQKRRLNITIQEALLTQLSKEIFDSKTGAVITEAENFAIELLNEWKTTKDPRYAKLIMDFVSIDP
jgi:hypothetical protein